MHDRCNLHYAEINRGRCCVLAETAQNDLTPAGMWLSIVQHDASTTKAHDDAACFRRRYFQFEKSRSHANMKSAYRGAALPPGMP